MGARRASVTWSRKLLGALIAKGSPEGQLGDIRFSALCLRVLGESFLNGDASRFEELWQRVQKEIESDRDYWQRREMESAVSKAATVFRSKHYSDVVSLLAPFESLLPRAQAAKLELARRRCQ